MTILTNHENATHLTYIQQTNLGSFYTPSHLVELVYSMLSKHKTLSKVDVVLEPGCGYGAFFNYSFDFESVKLIGADIDDQALAIAKTRYPMATFVHQNALFRADRSAYGIAEKSEILIVGNPPYNDKTSQVKNNIKDNYPSKIDEDIETRDLGISSLLAYAKLRPKYMAILHPLSYLIKKANFKLLRPMMKNYRLVDSTVFSSQEFSGTSLLSGFPIVAAIYEVSESGMGYEEILDFNFRTLNGEEFSVSQFDYIDNYISKYPSRQGAKFPSKYLFYTMRDINALKRSRTFIKDRVSNAVDVPENKLAYFHYVDVFKDFAQELPYYFGNFNIFIDHHAFLKYKEDFELLSKLKHPDIFNDEKIDNMSYQKALENVRAYFRDILSAEAKNEEFRI